MSYSKLVLVFLITVSFIRLVDLGQYWILEIVTHFPVQVGLASLILGLFFLRRKQVFFFIASFILSIINLSVLIDYGSPFTEKRDNSFNIYIANNFHKNPFESSLVGEIESLSAEIIFLSEVTPSINQKIKPFTKGYKFRVEKPDVGTEGLLLLSQFPIERYEIVALKEQGDRPILIADLLVHNEEITFYGVHAHNPASMRQFPQRVEHFRWLAQHIAENPNKVILAGDLNLTPYSPIFKDLIAVSQLKDSRTGFGWQPSWPSILPIFWIPIDHVLLSHEFQVHNRMIGPFIGSDHYPVTVEISL